MPTSVRFIAEAPVAGIFGFDEAAWPVARAAGMFTLESAAGGGFDVIGPAGGGVDPKGDIPINVLFIGDAAGAAAMGPGEGPRGAGGPSCDPQSPHTVASGFAGDPQRGQTLMRADYFPGVQNAMA